MNIFDIFKACYTGSMPFRVFSAILLISIFVWCFWGTKEIQKNSTNKNISQTKMEQSVKNSPGATAYQAGRDIK